MDFAPFPEQLDNGARCGEYRLSYWGAAWLARRRRRTAQASARRPVVLDRA
eukprot:COSAG06_NODE_43274_length_373_cov_1.131387_2_plen_50_part_01